MLNEWLENTQLLDEAGYFDEADNEFIKLSKYNAPRKDMKSRWSVKKKELLIVIAQKVFRQSNIVKEKDAVVNIKVNNG